MKIKVLEPDGSNNGKLKERLGSVTTTDGASTTTYKTASDWLVVKRGRYVHQITSHPLMSGDELYFKRVYAFETSKKYVYWLSMFGNKDSNSGLHIALNRWQHQRFLWMQDKNWLQKEENIRYLVNLVFLVIGVWLSVKKS
jgi:hypothetical protein